MSAGTLKLTNNSNAVVGTSTTFTTDLKSGDVISITIGGIPYTLFVDTVTSNTAATLTDAFTGPTTTGVAYVAVPQMTLNRITAALAAQTAEAVRRMLQENANWQAFYSGTGDITVTLPDGTPTGRQIVGPSWVKMMSAIGSPRQSRGDVGTADLNTIDGSVEGDYNQPRNSSATTARNYPVNLAGSLRVYSTNANNIKSCIQEYDVWDRNVTYTRCGVSTAAGVVTWTDWSDVSAGALRSTLIANTVDLDTLNSLAYLSTYRVSAGTVVNHYPYDAFAGTIEVVQGYSNGVQQFAESNYGNTFMRYMTSATAWSAWINTGMAAVPVFFTGNADTLLDDGDYPTTTTTTGLPSVPGLPGGANNCRLEVRSVRSNTAVMQTWYLYGSSSAYNGRRWTRTKYSTGAWSAWDEQLGNSQLGVQFGIGAANPVTTAVNWQTYNWVNGASLQIDAPTMTNAPAPVDSYTSGSLGINVLGVAGDPSATTGNAWGLLLVSAYVNGVGSTRRLFHVIFRGPNGARNYTVAEVFQLNNTLGISNGGTGASTQSGARASLDVFSTGEIGPEFINGLDLSVNGAVITCSSGSAYIPSAGIVRVSAPLTLTVTGLAANTWRHVYLYMNGTNPVIEAVTTEPVDYAYPAKQKTGANTRRYLGSFRVGAGPAMLPQVCIGGRVFYQNNWGGSNRALSNGMSMSKVAVAVSGWVPSTAMVIEIAVTNASSATATPVEVSSASNNSIAATPQGAKMIYMLPLDNYPSIYYQFIPNAPVTAGAYVDIGGYTYAR